MRRVIVKVQRDTQTTINKSVPAWEVPILAHIFDDSNVTLTDDTVDDNQDPLPTEEEFDRLVNCYGIDAKTDVPYVAAVYGQGGHGVRALRQAMEKVKQDSKTASKPAVKPKAKRDVSVDALLN